MCIERQQRHHLAAPRREGALARQRRNGRADVRRRRALRLGLDPPPASAADDVRQHQPQRDFGRVGDGETHGAVADEIDVVGQRRAHLGPFDAGRIAAVVITAGTGHAQRALGVLARLAGLCAR